MRSTLAERPALAFTSGVKRLLTAWFNLQGRDAKAIACLLGVFAVFLGVLFGIYRAQRVSMVDPPKSTSHNDASLEVGSPAWQHASEK